MNYKISLHTEMIFNPTGNKVKDQGIEQII